MFCVDHIGCAVMDGRLSLMGRESQTRRRSSDHVAPSVWLLLTFPSRPSDQADMRLPLTLILAFLAYESVLATPAKRDYNTHDYYVLEHNPLAGTSLADCARALGVEVVEQAGELQNHWLVRAAKAIEPLDKRRADPVMQALEDIQARAFSGLSARNPEASEAKRIASAVKYLSPQTLRQRVKRAPPPPVTNDEGFPTVSEIMEKMHITDPEFPRQWHLVNDKHPKNMMNVTGLWEEGITGKGVIAAMVDDGLDYTSEDLAPNFVSIPIQCS